MCELKVKGLSGTGDCWSGCVAGTETVEDKERPLTFSIHPNTFRREQLLAVSLA